MRFNPADGSYTLEEGDLDAMSRLRKPSSNLDRLADQVNRNVERDSDLRAKRREVRDEIAAFEEMVEDGLIDA